MIQDCLEESSQSLPSHGALCQKQQSEDRRGRLCPLVTWAGELWVAWRPGLLELKEFFKVKWKQRTQLLVLKWPHAPSSCPWQPSTLHESKRSCVLARCWATWWNEAALPHVSLVLHPSIILSKYSIRLKSICLVSLTMWIYTNPCIRAESGFLILPLKSQSWDTAAEGRCLQRTWTHFLYNKLMLPCHPSESQESEDKENKATCAEGLVH